MCGKAYDPRFIFAWPSAKIAVMSGGSAAKTLLQIKVSQLKKKGEEITPEAEKELLKSIMDKYESEMSPYYAASRLWVDDVIEPETTRTIISQSITYASHGKLEKFNVGVIQT